VKFLKLLQHWGRCYCKPGRLLLQLAGRKASSTNSSSIDSGLSS
jgi:hypothetical protein